MHADVDGRLILVGDTSDTSRCGISASRCWSLCLSFSDSTLDTFVRLFVCFRQTSEVQVAGRTEEARLITSHAHTHTLRMHTHTHFACTHTNTSHAHTHTRHTPALLCPCVCVTVCIPNAPDIPPPPYPPPPIYT
jgi:hypothetical protein